MRKALIGAGLLLLAAGLAWPWIAKIGLGRLPGDISIKREHFQFYFPVVTCLLLSAAVSLALWFFKR